MARSAPGPSSTAISTMVPSSGRARRKLSHRVAIGGQDPFHALGHVLRRQSGSGDIANVAVELERARARRADELREPARSPDLAPIGFAILQDIDPAHPPARVER